MQNRRVALLVTFSSILFFQCLLFVLTSCVIDRWMRKLHVVCATSPAAVASQYLVPRTLKCFATGKRPQGRRLSFVLPVGHPGPGITVYIAYVMITTFLYN